MSLLSKIEKGFMIILLYGKDTYRSREKLKEIIEEYKRKYESGMNLKFFSSEDVFEDLEDCEKQVSMFGEKKLSVIREVFSDDKLKKGVFERKERMAASEDIFIIHEEGEIKKNDELLDSFSKKNEGVMVQEFAPLSSKKLLSFIKKEFEKNGVEANKRAIEKLASLGGEDTWRIKNEIDKLSLYKRKITEEDVDLMVRMDAQTNIFGTIDAVAERENEKALLCLYDHLKKGDNPLYLLSMLGYQFRNLLIVKDFIQRGCSYGAMKQKSDLHPFVLKKSYGQAKKFSFEELKGAHHELFEMDLKTKTGQMDPVLALHIFLFRCEVS